MLGDLNDVSAHERSVKVFCANFDPTAPPLEDWSGRSMGRMCLICYKHTYVLDGYQYEEGRPVL